MVGHRSRHPLWPAATLYFAAGGTDPSGGPRGRTGLGCPGGSPPRWSAPPANVDVSPPSPQRRMPANRRWRCLTPSSPMAGWDAHLRFMADQLAALAQIVYNRPWVLWFSDACLWTSDVPVMILNGHDDKTQLRAAIYWDMILPLDSHRFLILPGLATLGDDPDKQRDRPSDEVPRRPRPVDQRSHLRRGRQPSLLPPRS